MNYLFAGFLGLFMATIGYWGLLELKPKWYHALHVGMLASGMNLLAAVIFDLIWR